MKRKENIQILNLNHSLPKYNYDSLQLKVILKKNKSRCDG